MKTLFHASISEQVPARPEKRFLIKLLILVICITSVEPAVAEHPFLICKRSEFAALRDRAANEPWKSMKSSAISASDAGVNTTSGSTLQKYIGACSLAYILDESRATTHKNRVRDAILIELDKIPFDPSLDHAGTVPPMAAAFMCILGLDVIYDDLTASEISACEAKIKSKIDLISKTGSWVAARWGTHRTWDIYKGTRTSPDNEFFNEYTRQMTVDGVTTVAPNYAFARLGSGDDRLQKTAYADVLEYTGIDKRYYTNQRLQNFYRWLFSSSVNPAKEYHMFGDVSPRWGPGSSAMLWRVGRFDYEASQYAAWLLSGSTPPGHLMTYVLMKDPLPEAVVPQSRLFMKGEAVFRETQDSRYALGSALYNITENAEWHTHDEVNAISVSAYGNRLLVNGGWLGDGMRPPAKNNTIAINGARHSLQTGAGLAEGILGNGFDYACGASGSALGNDSFNRSLLQVHARDGVNGYFLYADEVDADAGETVHAYLQTASESQITEVAAATEYQATINHHAKISGVNLSVFYATPPSVVYRALVESGDQTSDPASGSHYRLEARYATDGSGDARTLTILFPHNASHEKALMTRRSGTGFTGASMAQSGIVTDYVYTADGSVDCADNGISFRALLTFVRKVGSNDSLYFVRKGTNLQTGNIGFESSSPVSLLMDGQAGHITGSGADVTFYYPGISGVLINGVEAAVKSQGSNWVQVNVAAGTHSIELDIGNSNPLVHSLGSTSFTHTSASLSGVVVSGLSVDAWVCWGASDGGTLSTSTWDNVQSVGSVLRNEPFSATVSGLSTNATYWYRFFVSNSAGIGWSDEAMMFSGRPAGGVWMPEELVAWYDASDLSTITQDGGAVSEWRDKSGNGHHLTQRTGANRLTTGTTINGLNVLRCGVGGAVTYMTRVGGLGTTIRTKFLVLKSDTGFDHTSTPGIITSSVDDDVSTGVAFGASTGALADEVITVFDEDNPDVYVDRQGVSRTNLSAIDNDTHIFSFTLGANWFMGFDGSEDLRDLTSGTRNPFYYSASFALGAQTRQSSGAYDRPYRGYIAECLLIEDTITEANRQKIEGYLAHKWGLAGSLPSDHPCKTPPVGSGPIANQFPSAITNNAATFNASLSAVGTNYNVHVYWGTTDGGTNAGTWAANSYVGSYTNVSTNISFAATGLQSEQTYYYTFRAANAETNVWASPSWRFCALPLDNELSVAYETWLETHYGTTEIDDSELCANGVNTIREAYIAGLNPSNTTSRFVISGAGMSAGSMLLSWDGLPGRLYDVYWSSNLLYGGFHLIGSNILWNASEFADTVYRPENAGYYRIEVKLEE